MLKNNLKELTRDLSAKQIADQIVKLTEMDRADLWIMINSLEAKVRQYIKKDSIRIEKENQDFFKYLVLAIAVLKSMTPQEVAAQIIVWED